MSMLIETQQELEGRTKKDIENFKLYGENAIKIEIKEEDVEHIKKYITEDKGNVITGFDSVNKPQHYTDTRIEVIDYIEDKNLGFCLGNAIKYISRAGRKHSADKSDKEKMVEDLNKAIWYLNRRIKEIEEGLCD